MVNIPGRGLYEIKDSNLKTKRILYDSNIIKIRTKSELSYHYKNLLLA